MLAAIRRNEPSGGVDSPSTLDPQQATLPSTRMAQECVQPAATSTKPVVGAPVPVDEVAVAVAVAVTVTVVVEPPPPAEALAPPGRLVLAPQALTSPSTRIRAPAPSPPRSLCRMSDQPLPSGALAQKRDPGFRGREALTTSTDRGRTESPLASPPSRVAD